MNENKPHLQLKTNLSNNIPENLIEFLPNKWEKIGDVLVFNLSEKLIEYQNIIAKEYAKILSCKSVLKQIGEINGTYRIPNVRLIYGEKNTVTSHKENGIKYKLDPQKIMFSSGNMSERLRMANISNKNEIIVDLFAGIGYFTLPTAVYSRPKKIFACEINPVSYDYLCQNIVLNHVTEIVEPVFGDSKKIAPKNIADRIFMGYFGDTIKFLPKAINCLKNGNGIIHFHNICPVEKKPLVLLEEINKSLGNNKKAELLKFTKVKSYAPGINHVVLDIKLMENE